MTLNEKSLNKILKEQREDFQNHIDKRLVEQEERFERYIGVVSEEFQSQMKLVAESVGGVHQQLVALRDMVAKNTEDIEVMKMDLHIIKDDLKERVDRKEFKTLEHRLALVERKMSRPFRVARG